MAVRVGFYKVVSHETQRFCRSWLCLRPVPMTETRQGLCWPKQSPRLRATTIAAGFGSDEDEGKVIKQHVAVWSHYLREVVL